MEENLEWTSSSVRARWWEWAGAVVMGKYIAVTGHAWHMEGLLWRGRFYMVRAIE